MRFFFNVDRLWDRLRSAGVVTGTNGLAVVTKDGLQDVVNTALAYDPNFRELAKKADEADSYKDQAQAWCAVHEALCKVVPDLHMRSEQTGRDRAVGAILDLARKVSERGSQDDKQYQQLRECFESLQRTHAQTTKTLDAWGQLKFSQLRAAQSALSNLRGWTAVQEVIRNFVDPGIARPTASDIPVARWGQAQAALLRAAGLAPPCQTPALTPEEKAGLAQGQTQAAGQQTKTATAAGQEHKDVLQGADLYRTVYLFF
jgi:hypothetical protein